MNSLRQALLNITHTENGALTFHSTLDSVMDFYYHAPAKRGRNEEVVALFQAAYAEQPALALLALFNLRDIRGGKGERASFRACLAWLAEQSVRTCRPIRPALRRPDRVSRALRRARHDRRTTARRLRQRAPIAAGQVDA